MEDKKVGNESSIRQWAHLHALKNLQESHVTTVFELSLLLGNILSFELPDWWLQLLACFNFFLLSFSSLHLGWISTAFLHSFSVCWLILSHRRDASNLFHCCAYFQEKPPSLSVHLSARWTCVHDALIDKLWLQKQFCTFTRATVMTKGTTAWLCQWLSIEINKRAKNN